MTAAETYFFLVEAVLFHCLAIIPQQRDRLRIVCLAFQRAQVNPSVFLSIKIVDRRLDTSVRETL